LRGSTVERILKEDVTRLPIALPHVDEQAKIAQILGALDDKIDLNRRMNETLEEATRALFKSWFVDFDPVRAKAAGRQPFGMDAATAALFPDRFVDSELRAVPKGWSVVALEDLFVLKRGYDLPAAERRPGQVPIYSSSGHSGSHAEVKARGPGVVTGRYGTIGQVYFVDEDFWPLNTTLYVVDFKQTPPIYAYYALARVDFAKFSDKAAVPGVNRNHLHQELVVQPTPLAMMAFSSTVDTWRRRVLAATEESSTLGAIRDYLLPKLLSGEIRVRDAETLAGKAL
jgi:type I restriction enzyme S subunit